MDDRVIEAAAMAILTEFGEVPYYRDIAEAAIRAADAARAEDVKAAVRKFESSVLSVAINRSYDRRDAALSELYDLLGIEDRP